jgi:hypothetical protein
MPRYSNKQRKLRGLGGNLTGLASFSFRTT